MPTPRHMSLVACECEPPLTPAVHALGQARVTPPRRAGSAVLLHCAASHHACWPARALVASRPWRALAAAPERRACASGRRRRRSSSGSTLPSRPRPRASCAVALVVAATFLGPPPFAGARVRHLNANELDNRAANLAWPPQSEAAPGAE